LEQHADQLREVCIAGDEQRDAALYAALREPALDALAEQRRERAFGLYTMMEEVSNE
jgi:hypothetical protein